MNRNRPKTAVELNEELYFKLAGELADYREELLAMSPDEILQCVERYVIFRDIVDCLEVRDISAKHAEQLLKTENVLDAIFVKWENLNSKHMDRIKEAIECKANEIGREENLIELKARKARDRDAR
ncbi:MAG: DUF3848 domain-containing protein [Eubacteriales bacterium]